MKISKSLFLAFAGLGLFACSNEDVTEGINGNPDETMAIAVQLEGLSQGSRGIDTPITGDTGEGKQKNTTITSAAILFSDGTNVLKAVSLNSTDNLTDWTNFTKPADGKVYVVHEVPGTVRSVQIIGNYKAAGLEEYIDGDGGDNKGLVGGNKATLADVKAKTIESSSQQTFENVAVFGEDNTLELSEYQHQEGDSDKETATKVYKADVTVKHLFSRIEIGNIQCEDLGEGNLQLEELLLKHIGLLNYYNTTAINGTGSNPMTNANVLEPGTTSIGDNNYCWDDSELSTDKYATRKWAWDAFAQDTKLTSKNDIFNPDKTTGSKDGKFVYQFVPEQVKINDAAKDFHIKLYVKATLKDDSEYPLHTITAKLPGIHYGVAGYIYKVDLKFKEGNLGPWNPDEKVCIEVKVTAEPWNIETLTPEFI